MLEQLLGQVELSPLTAAGDWRDRLITVLSSYTSILFGRLRGRSAPLFSALASLPSNPALSRVPDAGPLPMVQS